MRSSRIQVLQDLLDRARKLIDARAKQYADLPGGATGLLVEDFKGKDATGLPRRHRPHGGNQERDEAGGDRNRPVVEKKEESGTMNVIIERLNAGRKRAAERNAVAAGI